MPPKGKGKRGMDLGKAIIRRAAQDRMKKKALT
jgi:hypothetical protein